MSRLDEEYLMAVVRNRSGIDSGEIDYSIPSDRFNKQTISCLREIQAELHRLSDKCTARIVEVEECPHDWKREKDSRLDTSRCSKCHWQKFNKTLGENNEIKTN